MRRTLLHAATVLIASSAIGCLADETSGETGATGGGGKADDSSTTFKDVITQWEHRVGSGGDAWVNDVTIATDGGLMVTSTFPRWLRKLTPEGDRDETWGLLDPISTTRRSGYLDLPAHQIWNVGSDRFVAASGDGDLFELRGYLANGTLDPAFGADGRVDLYSEGHRLRAAYDASGSRFIVVFARAWETFGYFSKGPSKLELIAYDDKTGARSSLGAYDMPSWDNDGTNPAKIREVLARADGSIVLLASETIHTPNPARADVATQWSTIRLVAGQAPEVTHIAVTSYDPRVVAFTALDGGAFDLYLWGTVDGISTTYNDNKLVRVSVDEAGAAEQVAVAGPDFSTGCASALATSTHLVFGQSIDRSQPIQFAAYPKSGGAPVTFASDLPQRCLTGLTLGANGHIYGGTTDTSGTAWVYNIVSFAPAAP